MEVLVKDSSASLNLQVFLDPLRRQDQTSFFQPRHRLVVVRGSFLQAEFLGEKEKGLILLGVVNPRNSERTLQTPETLGVSVWHWAVRALASNQSRCLQQS